MNIIEKIDNFLINEQDISYLEKLNAQITNKLVKLPLNKDFTLVMERTEKTERDRISGKTEKKSYLQMDHLVYNGNKIALDPREIIMFPVDKASIRMLERMVEDCKKKDDQKEIKKIIYKYNEKQQRLS